MRHEGNVWIKRFSSEHPFLFWVAKVIGGELIWTLLVSLISIPRRLHLFLTVDPIQASPDNEYIFLTEELGIVNQNVFFCGAIVIALLIILSSVFSLHTSKKALKRQKQSDEVHTKDLLRIQQERDEIKEKYDILDKQTKSQREISQLVSVLQEYTIGTEIVDCIQLFEHSDLSDSGIASSDNLIDVSVQFIDGCTNKNVNVNALFCSHYIFERDIFDSLTSLLNAREKYLSECQRRRDKTREKHLQDHAIELVKELNNRLNTLALSEISDIHYVYYRVLEILTTLVLMPDAKAVEIERLLQGDAEVEAQLKTGRRTGILGSLLLNSSYAFSNEHSFVKKDRYYFTTPLLYKEHNLIMLVVLQGNMLRTGPQQDKLKCCEEIYDQIKDLLKSKLVD